MMMADFGERVTAAELHDVWPILTPDERIEGFEGLPREDADDFFLDRSARSQAMILERCSPGERRIWLRLLDPDDAADLLQEVENDVRTDYLGLLDQATRLEVKALMAYAEDEAGGLMSPRFARIRPETTVEEAIRYVRRQARDQIETIYYLYVVDAEQVLCGVISFRELLTAPGDKIVREVMTPEVITVREDMDEEEVARVIAHEDFLALPVVDSQNRIQGIVTVDDVVDVIEREATEDMHKMGGQEALDVPYLQTSYLGMLKKRAGWLAILFLGELLTASAMAQYEEELQQAVVLALFIPLIISSGGNSGSQTSTLVIRAMALGEVRMRDWWRVLKREIGVGITLGILLAIVGFLRVILWEGMFGAYGEGFELVGVTVAVSLVGVVAWGTISGSMLPLILRKVGFDPASASAPFVATLVDVIGLVIYFNVAFVVLRGVML